MNNPEDIELIKKVRNGDADSQDFLLRRYSGLVRGLTRKCFLMGGEQEDLFQEGLLALLKAISSYDENKNKSFSSFATMCVRTKIIDTIRAATREKHKPLNDAGELTDEPDSFPPFISDPLDAYLEREKLENFYISLNKVLSPQQNALLRLYFDGFSYNEIAEKLMLPIKKVDNTLNSIKNKIKKEKKIFI